MKKLILLAVAATALCACGGSDAPFSYRGLAFSTPVSQFIDSMAARGFAIDSAASDSGRLVVLANPQEHYRVLAAFEGDQLQAIQEHYHVSTNDSTRRLWQQIRDNLEQELGEWPDCPMLKDDHKIANFDTGTGFVSVILENTHRPDLKVQYSLKKSK